MAKISGVLGERRVIPAEDQRAEIAEAVRPESGRVPLTPAQARRAAQNEWTGEDAPPGYTHHKVEVRSDRELAERARRESDTAPAPIEAKPERGTGQRAQAAAAVSVIRDFRAHLDRVKANAEAARGGGAEREDRAVDEIRKTRALGETIKAKLETTL